MWFEGGLASSAFRPPTNLTTRSPWGRKESDTTERLHFTSPTRRARQGGRSLPHALIRSEPCAASGPSQVRRPASGVQRGLLRKAFQDSCGLRLGGLGSGSRCAGCCVSAAASGREARAEPAGGGATAAAAHLPRARPGFLEDPAFKDQSAPR